jgi:signal transduction histidine kinase
MAQHIIGPLKELAVAAQVMTEGDLTRRAIVDRHDELGDLACRFNSMADQLKQTLDALQDERDKVAELAHTQQEMVANVSHDLRTPLASLNAHIESLESHPEFIGRYLPILHDETTRLACMVDDLFALARLDARELELNLTRVELRPLVKKILTAFTDQAWEDHRIVFETDIPEDLPNVLGDAIRIEQVLSNLLTNSLRYTPEGGIITVSVREQDEGWMEVRVMDTGTGIALEDLPHVFERFYQADPARSRGGAGLGLTISKSLVEAMAGKIGVESVLGEGACFWFWLPGIDLDAKLKQNGLNGDRCDSVLGR